MTHFHWFRRPLVKGGLFLLIGLFLLSQVVGGLIPSRAETGSIEAINELKSPTEEFLHLPLVVKTFTPTVTILIQSASADMFEAGFADFEAQTGIDLVFIGTDSFEQEILQRALTGDLPDLAYFPQPGLLGDLAAQGYTKDLLNWFTLDYLQDQFDQSWLDLATFEGQIAGVWFSANIKSIVYYPQEEFEAAGYQIPTTWAEMLTLSDQMVADGRTPWCIGVASGGASGWPGTDWVEDILLRTAPVADYDAWTQGALLFNSAQVSSAFEKMGEIWFAADYVYGGRGAINTTSFADSPVPMFAESPGCWLHRQGSFISGFFPAEAVYGVDYGYFYLPPIDPQYGNPILGSGNLFGVFSQTPEVYQFVHYLTTPESNRWLVESRLGLSPHKQFDLSWYPDEEERGYAQILADANVFRYDGSDLMPGVVGTGTFWQGILDYVDGEDLTTILNHIDASWP